MNESDIPPCLIYIDKEGRWFHKGLEMIHRDFIRLFYENLSQDSQGRYIISLGNDRCYLDVEDTPFVVWRTAVSGQDQGNSRFSLHLSDDSREDLSPETLYVGERNVLYCRVKNGAFPARFDRQAYYQLAEHVEEEKGRFFLVVEGKKYPIRMDGPSTRETGS